MKQPGYSEIKRRIRRLVFKHRMIEPDDRVAVGLSGGKDSAFLLHILTVFREEFRWRFDLSAYRVIDRFSPCYTTAGIDACKTWCQEIGVPLKLIEPPDPQHHQKDSQTSACFKCAWRRKELLFKSITDDGIRNLAMGHTAFDLATTALMNMIYHGHLETMPPVMNFFSGKIKVIRPLSVVSEEQVLRQHRRLKLPPPPPACLSYVGEARANAEKWVREMLQENQHALFNINKAAERWPSDIMK